MIIVVCLFWFLFFNVIPFLVDDLHNSPTELERKAYEERKRKEYEERMKRKKTASVRYLEKEIKEYNLNLPQELIIERNRRNKELGGNWIVTPKGEWINISQYDHVCYF